jgi:hypothetical protein
MSAINQLTETSVKPWGYFFSDSLSGVAEGKNVEETSNVTPIGASTKVQAFWLLVWMAK